MKLLNKCNYLINKIDKIKLTNQIKVSNLNKLIFRKRLVEKPE